MHTPASANNVPIAAPIAPKYGIRRKFRQKFITAPVIIENRYSKSLQLGIRYCVRTIFATVIKGIVNTKIEINDAQEINSFPQNIIVKLYEIAEIPNINAIESHETTVKESCI